MVALEDRVVPTVSTVLDAGALTITSDSDSDSIALFGKAGDYRMSVNGGSLQSFSGVTSISIFGGDGDDIIDTSAILDAIGVTIDGGAGNDTIIGSQGNDTLLGGDGDDSIDGGLINVAGALKADPGTPLPFAAGSTGVNLTSMGRMTAANGTTYSVWRLRNGTAGSLSATLKVYNGAVIWSGTITPITDLYVASSNISATHQMIWSSGNTTKASGTQNFSLTFPTSGDDTINGGAGADTINGKDGNDTIIVSSLADGLGDTIDGSSGNDTLALSLSGAEWNSLSPANRATIELYVANPANKTLSIAGFISSAQRFETASLDISNTAPVGVDDFFSVLHDDPLSGNVLDNDSDIDNDFLTVSLISNGLPAHGAVNLNADGTFTYTPNEGYVGFDFFSYSLTDGKEVTAPVTVSISVTNRTLVWDGGGSDEFASTKENWVGDVAPASGDSIVFDVTSSKKALPFRGANPWRIGGGGIRYGQLRRS